MGLTVPPGASGVDLIKIGSIFQALMVGACAATHTTSIQTVVSKLPRAPSHWTTTWARGRITGTNTRQRCAWSRARRRSARAAYSCPGATGCTAASTAAQPVRRDRSVVSSAATLPNTCQWVSAGSTSTSCLRTQGRTRCAQETVHWSRCTRCARRDVVSAQLTASRFHQLRTSRAGEACEL